MQNNALYYPHINFHDSAWLKSMALLYDRIYRIVPNNVKTEDDNELMPLLEDDFIGKAINPAAYSVDASAIFLKNLPEWTAAALTFTAESEKELTRIHRDKTDERVRKLFKESGYQEENDWMTIPTSLASNFMLFLAKEISRKNNLALITNDWGAWTGTNYFNLNGQLDEYITSDMVADYISSSYGLFSLLISEVTPVNISEIPADKILNFRNKRADEIKHLRKCASDLLEELKEKIDENELKLDAIETKAKELNLAKEEYKKSADIINAKAWFGIAFMGFPAPLALGTIFSIPFASVVTLSATSLALGYLFNINNQKSELKLNKENSASWIFELRHSFKKYTSARRGGDMNYHAWNCMEEYVND